MVTPIHRVVTMNPYQNLVSEYVRLLNEALKTGIEYRDLTQAIDLLTEDNFVIGIVCQDRRTNETRSYKITSKLVIDASGIIMAAGSMGMFGISLNISLVIILLAGMAVYDAISVYKTKHMLDLADTFMRLKVPAMLIIPFQTSPIIEEGSSSCRKRCHRPCPIGARGLVEFVEFRQGEPRVVLLADVREVDVADLVTVVECDQQPPIPNRDVARHTCLLSGPGRRRARPSACATPLPLYSAVDGNYFKAASAMVPAASSIT
jgi:hypothetical protein